MQVFRLHTLTLACLTLTPSLLPSSLLHLDVPVSSLPPSSLLPTNKRMLARVVKGERGGTGPSVPQRRL
ncbi:hypothetical protein E2C01_045489 [Portunus trituberculatus]|uniref:Secreted protein n=1 Tax=Portunus trituberculatus TaxID=210409 RepID=A0A5B7G3B6_PORTR|nr:hypothetical protein [Portunus trituberculatus]